MFFYRKPWARAPIFIAGLLLGTSYMQKSGVFAKDFKKSTRFYTNMLLGAFLIITLLLVFPVPLLSDPEFYAGPKEKTRFLA
jgi:hypothetical protein